MILATDFARLLVASVIVAALQSVSALQSTPATQAWVVRSTNLGLVDCSVEWSFKEFKDLRLVFSPPSEYLAKAVFEERRIETGWTELTIETSFSASQSEARFAAGVLEGFLTSHDIESLVKNAKSMRNPTVFDQTMNHLKTWQETIQIKAAQNGKTDSYWLQIQLVLDRFKGLKEVLNHSCSSLRISEADLLLLQSDGDVFDIEQMFINLGKQGSTPSIKTEIMLMLKRRLAKGLGETKAFQNDDEFHNGLVTQEKCSALIRKTSHGDILLGHATWASYVEMVRVFKNIHYAGDGIKISNSGFAGMLASTDDWYVTNQGLAVMETSLNLLDASSHNMLWEDKFKGVPSWLRTIAATETAKTGKEWVETFSKESSGTYNCQWMILDRKQKGKAEGLFYVLESMPRTIHSQDMTEDLLSKGFFSSQNTPMFDVVRNAALYPNVTVQLETGICTKCTCHFSYDENPRGCIFKRDAPGVETLDDMKALLRSNKWKTDSLSLGLSSNAIAGRFDLLPEGKGRYPAGAIDGKVLSLFDDDSFASHEIVGGIVVNQQCPVFNDWVLLAQYQLSHEGITGLSGQETWMKTKRFVL